jgi:hypothetical protein
LCCQFSAAAAFFLPNFFRGWTDSEAATAAAGCKAVCQLSLTCWMEGGSVDQDGDCPGFFKVRNIRFNQFTFLLFLCTLLVHI